MKLFWYMNCDQCGNDAEIKSDTMEKAFENREIHYSMTTHGLDNIWIYSDLEEEAQ